MERPLYVCLTGHRRRKDAPIDSTVRKKTPNALRLSPTCARKRIKNSFMSRGPRGVTDLRFSSPQPDTRLYIETTSTHGVMCPFIPHTILCLQSLLLPSLVVLGRPQSGPPGVPRVLLSKSARHHWTKLATVSEISIVKTVRNVSCFVFSSQYCSCVICIITFSHLYVLGGIECMSCGLLRLMIL